MLTSMSKENDEGTAEHIRPAGEAHAHSDEEDYYYTEDPVAPAPAPAKQVPTKQAPAAQTPPKVVAKQVAPAPGAGKGDAKPGTLTSNSTSTPPPAKGGKSSPPVANTATTSTNNNNGKPASFGGGPALPQPPPPAPEGKLPAPSSSAVGVKKTQPVRENDTRNAQASNDESMMARIMKLVEVTPARQRLFLNILFYYTLICLFFLILQCPLSQLDEAGGGCFTFWGYKLKCDTVSYTYRVSTLPCTGYKIPLQVGAALSIINILLYTALALILWRVVSNTRHQDRREEKRRRQAALSSPDAALKQELVPLGLMRWVITGMVGAGFVLQLICFSVIASVYSSRPCQDTSLRRTTAYGVGFGILLTTWCFTLILLPLCGYVAFMSTK